MSIFHDQYQFLKAAGAEEGTLKAEELASELINEEYDEFKNELFYLGRWQNHDTIKEALDLIYVTCQYLNVTIGPDKAAECWKALHDNNMSKCIDGKLVKREDGKVLKGPDYKPLNLAEVLKRD